MRRPDLVLVTGPAGAGKTTVADAWARAQVDPTAHVSLDDVRDWVKSGYADPADGWTPIARDQYRLARRCAALSVREHLAHGHRCVVDDAVFPDRPDVDLAGWERDLDSDRIDLVVLTASPATLGQRNARRRGHRRLPVAMLEAIHAEMAGWADRAATIVDTTGLTVAETVAAVDQALSQANP